MESRAGESGSESLSIIPDLRGIGWWIPGKIEDAPHGSGTSKSESGRFSLIFELLGFGER